MRRFSYGLPDMVLFKWELCRMSNGRRSYNVVRLTVGYVCILRPNCFTKALDYQPSSQD